MLRISDRHILADIVDDIERLYYGGGEEGGWFIMNGREWMDDRIEINIFIEYHCCFSVLFSTNANIAFQSWRCDYNRYVKDTRT